MASPRGTSLPGSPTPDTRQSRGFEGLLAPRQGWRGPWHSALIPPGLNSCRVKQVLLAQAEAEKIRRIGEAEAAVIEAMGKAEAERMKLKAEAYQKYGDAAKMALVLEALPQVRPSPRAGLAGLVRDTATGWQDALHGGVLRGGQEPYNSHGRIPGPLPLTNPPAVACKQQHGVWARKEGRCGRTESDHQPSPPPTCPA